MAEARGFSAERHDAELLAGCPPDLLGAEAPRYLEMERTAPVVPAGGLPSGTPHTFGWTGVPLGHWAEAHQTLVHRQRAQAAYHRAPAAAGPAFIPRTEVRGTQPGVAVECLRLLEDRHCSLHNCESEQTEPDCLPICFPSLCVELRETGFQQHGLPPGKEVLQRELGLRRWRRWSILSLRG
jgi:hypothetical protein